MEGALCGLLQNHQFDKVQSLPEANAQRLEKILLRLPRRRKREEEKAGGGGEAGGRAKTETGMLVNPFMSTSKKEANKGVCDKRRKQSRDFDHAAFAFG